MIRLDSIWDTEKGNNDYPAVKEALIERFEVEKMYDLKLADICESQNKHSGYGTHTYTGVLKEDIEVSELELAIICDSGYSFFGGSSKIDSSRNFKVEIWFD